MSAMLKMIWGVIWNVTGLCVAGQSAYWAALYVGWGLGYFDDPKVSADWIAIAFIGNMFFMAGRAVAGLAATLGIKEGLDAAR